MKLYATTTSERASKGQGGNEYLDIVIMNEGQEVIARFKITPSRYGQRIQYAIDNNYAYLDDTGEKKLSLNPKGKQQKGDKCHKCGDSEAGLTENDDGNLTCDNCWA